MIVKSFEDTIKTLKSFEIIDVTSKVEGFVKESDVTEGVVNIISKHTTAAIRVNENEPLLFKDIELHVDSLAQGNGYHHDRILERKDCPENEPKNAHAHLKALLMGASETLPVKEGKISLGKWQRILFLELDGPRERTYTVVVMGK